MTRAEYSLQTGGRRVFNDTHGVHDVDVSSEVAGHVWIVPTGVARQRFRLRPPSPVRGQTRE